MYSTRCGNFARWHNTKLFSKINCALLGVTIVLEKPIKTTLYIVWCHCLNTIAR